MFDDNILGKFHIPLLICLSVTCLLGVLALYSVAGGHLSPWSLKQGLRFLLGLGILLAIVPVRISFWKDLAYVVYALAFGLTVLADIIGHVSLGAKRWIALGTLHLQPSEIMKVALFLALARFLCDKDLSRFGVFFLAICLITIPAFFVAREPDLGTGLMIVFSGMCMLFVSGAPMRFFFYLGAGALASIPFVWMKLHTYQKNRVLTFLFPDRDPTRSGYHILQSKIAIGSGLFLGKGFTQSTQSKLSFLPEKHTDFIFSIIAEEWGFIGCFVLLALYSVIIMIIFNIALQSKNPFHKFLAIGIGSNFFLYIFVNTGMTMGLMPVVGIPLPFISFGGTSVISLMISFGLLMSMSCKNTEGIID